MWLATSLWVAAALLARAPCASQHHRFACSPESPVSINGRRMTRQELLEFERDAYEPPYKQEVLSVGPVSVNAAGDEAYATVCGRLTYAFRSGADTFGLPRKGVASTVESYFLKKVDGTWRVAEEMWDMKPCGEC